MVFVFSVKSDFRYSLLHSTTLAVPLSGLQTTQRKFYPPQPDFIRLFLYPLRVLFNFVLFHEYQKQPPYLLQIHPCIAFLFSNSHCMQFARLCNCPQSIKLLEIMPQNTKLLVKLARFATESLYSQNESRPPKKMNGIYFCRMVMLALLLFFCHCTRRRPYRPPHPSSGTGS